jgi:hypothetical protein
MGQSLKDAITTLAARGHVVRPLDHRKFDIDGRMLVNRLEVLELAEGLYSVSEMHERFVLRLAREN